MQNEYCLQQAWLAQLIAFRLADSEIQVQIPARANLYEHNFWTNWTSIKAGLMEDLEFLVVNQQLLSSNWEQKMNVLDLLKPILT